MLETWDAKTFEGVSQEGKTMPMFIRCSMRPNLLVPGEEEEFRFNETFLVKAPGQPHVEPFSMFNEIRI